MIHRAKSETESLAGIKKAAMLLVVLGEEASAQIMRQLSEEEIQRIGKEVAQLSSISCEQAEHVLNEFHHLSNTGEFISQGGLEFAKKMLSRAFDPEVARRMTERVAKAIGPDAASFDALQKA